MPPQLNPHYLLGTDATHLTFPHRAVTNIAFAALPVLTGFSGLADGQPNASKRPSIACPRLYSSERNSTENLYYAAGDTYMSPLMMRIAKMAHRCIMRIAHPHTFLRIHTCM
jgi:hypothetical protein